MSLKILLAVILTTNSFKISEQIKQGDIWLQVLKSNRVGREFIFKTEDNSVTRLTYIGLIRSKKGVAYKIMNSIWLWGEANHRATTRILVFDSRDKYLGNYYLTMSCDIPSFIKANKLVFTNKRSSTDCDYKTITYVDFDKGIPKEFFRKCAGESGDFYTFDKE
jgi:hypothetical protein